MLIQFEGLIWPFQNRVWVQGAHPGGPPAATGAPPEDP